MTTTTPTSTAPALLSSPALRLRRLWTAERVRALCLHLDPDGGGQAELAYLTKADSGTVSLLCRGLTKRPQRRTLEAVDRVARNTGFT